MIYQASLNSGIHDFPIRFRIDRFKGCWKQRKTGILGCDTLKKDPLLQGIIFFFFFFMWGSPLLSDVYSGHFQLYDVLNEVT